jgi:sugar lactone lactonase YvrE
MRRLRSLTISVVAVAACAPKGEQAGADSVKPADSAGAMAAPSKVGEVGGMRTPESVRYDSDLDRFYVSNIDGNPSQKDGKSSIVVVRADSTSVVTTLVEGGKNGATLNAPKGLALVGDTLWVADIDAVRGFNRRTGAPLVTIDLRSKKATFLNDVAASADGSIYVTDTGIAFDANGAMSHAGVDRIFKISGRTVTEAAKGDSLARPNGIAWDGANARWIIGPFGGNEVVAWKEGDPALSRVATGPGQYDGVEVLGDGRILVSSWADSAIHVINNGAMTKLISGVSAPADIGVDTRRNVVAVPRFSDNKVEFFKLP